MPVNGDLDGKHPLILGTLVQKFDEGRHAVVRVGKVDVLFAHVFDERFRLFQRFGDLPLEGRIAQLRRLFLGEIIAERKEKFIIEKVRFLKAVGGVQIQLVAHESAQGRGQIVHFQPHHAHMRARFDLPFHDLGKIVLDVRIVHARVEIGIARDAEHHFPTHRVSRKRQPAERFEQFLHGHNLRLVAVADAVQPLDGRIDVHDPDHSPAVPLQIADEIILFVFKADHGMLCIQHHQRQKRHDAADKVPLAFLPLTGSEIFRREDAKPRLVEFAAQPDVHGSAVFVLFAHHRHDARQLFGRRELRLVVRDVGAGQHFVVQAPHAHHEKFVRVGGENR